MEKSYIIRIYKQENETVKGIVEDVELNKREKFSNPNQLWSLITSNTNKRSISNVVEATKFNAIRDKTSVSN